MEFWEANLIENVATDAGWDLVEAFSRQMRCMPEDVVRSADILADKLSKAGLHPVVYKPKIYLGIPIGASICGNGLAIACKASALSPDVKSLTAQMVHLPANPVQQGVHTGDANSLFETKFATETAAIASVKGKIVLTEGMSNPARTQLLQTWGAVAVVVINPGRWSHWGTNSVVWGSPLHDEMDRLPKIASVAVSRSEGDRLLEAAARNEEITLSVDAMHGWFEQP